jgi:hypothetical protein
MITVCENCCREIEDTEGQKCPLCEMDGLGNCCVAPQDHDCQMNAGDQDS